MQKINWTKELPKEPGIYFYAFLVTEKQVGFIPMQTFMTSRGLLVGWAGKESPEGAELTNLEPGLWSQSLVEWPDKMPVSEFNAIRMPV